MGDHDNHSPPLPIHFFKIILQTNLERIKMPNKFTLRYGGDLSNPVFLRAPDLTEWEVQWTKENDEIWFENGWKNFVENYSLESGHFVLFHYGGTSQIDVLIFDQSALEIDYLSSDNIDEEMGTLDQRNAAAVKINKIEHNRKPISSMVSSRTRKKMGSSSNKNVKRKFEPQKMSVDVVVPYGEGTKFKFGENVKHRIKDRRKTSKTRSLNTPKLLRAQAVAKKFETENYFFTIVIEKSHLEENAGKQVPKFTHVVSKKKKDLSKVTLKFGNRSWDVKLSTLAHSKYDKLTSGWSLFAEKTNLQVGDICIFELIDPNLMLFEVHVTNA